MNQFLIILAALVVGAFLLTFIITVVIKKTPQARNYISVVLLLVVGYLSYEMYESIASEVRDESTVKARRAEVVARLKDIRTAQLAYRESVGSFAKSFDSLAYVLNNGKFTVIKVIGNPDDSSQVVKRETIVIPIKDSLQKMLKVPFDQLRFIPLSDGKAEFILDAGEIVKNGVKVQVFECRDSAPTKRETEQMNILKVGSMTDANIAGNWEK